MIDVSTPKARHRFYGRSAWQTVRKQVLKRDNYECVWCKKKGRVTTAKTAKLEVDHIKELEYYPELALDPSNLRTLCHDCHNIRHDRHNDNRKVSDDEIFYF